MHFLSECPTEDVGQLTCDGCQLVGGSLSQTYFSLSVHKVDKIKISAGSLSGSVFDP